MSGHRQKGQSAPNIVNSAIITLLYAFGNSHFLTVCMAFFLIFMSVIPYHPNRCLLFYIYVVQYSCAK